MKIAIINDTHFGARGDSQLFFDHFIKFFENVFFPYIKENNIDTVIHAGDLMDRRKYVNFNILNQVRTKFIDRLRDEGVELHCILGNHDVYYRNTNMINSIRELFNSDLKLYEEPTVMNFDGLDVALLPWVNKENHDKSIDFIKTAPAPILIGHLELQGYDVMRGVKYDGGMNPKLFERYEQVLTGHFHCRQEHGNIYYMGTQYQITFADLNEQKGFHVFDTDKREIEFIPNPYKMFHSVSYNDENGPIDSDNYDCSNFKDSYIKLYVENKKHPYSFERFMDKLYDCGVAKITVVEELIDSEWTKEEIVDIAQDTVTLINNEIDSIEEVKDKAKMKKIIKDLYMESLSL
jgi:DNA repair exonuclease SbcCD nuclease subunit|tara:strand:- start:159 stop:1205 length:1047 start_codon:yes stop_codon:yes gene_type:complete